MREKHILLVAVLCLFVLCFCSVAMAEEEVRCESCGSTYGHYEDYRIRHQFVCADCGNGNAMTPHTLDCECHMWVAGEEGPYCYGCGKKNPNATNLVAMPTATPTATPVQSTPTPELATPTPTAAPTPVPNPNTPVPEMTAVITTASPVLESSPRPLPNATQGVTAISEPAKDFDAVWIVVIALLLVVVCGVGVVFLLMYKRQNARRRKAQSAVDDWSALDGFGGFDSGGASGFNSANDDFAPTTMNKSRRRRKDKKQIHQANEDDFFGL